jgi:hypothetical protein
MFYNGETYLRFPNGIRIVTDRQGLLEGLIGMTVRTVQGIVEYDGMELQIEVKGNQRMDYRDGKFTSTADIGVVHPTYQ